MFKNIIISLLFLTQIAFGSTESPSSTKTEFSPIHILGEVVCSEFECYTLTEELGEGAFGKVFAAENGDGKKFAIKCYKHGEIEEGRFWELLADAEREFERGQLLKHPNILKANYLFSTVDEKGGKISHLVLELVNGKTLEKAEAGELSKEEVLEAVKELIDALRYALKMGLFHIDLSTRNVMLDKDHHLIVVDLASFFCTEEIFFRPEGEDGMPSEQALSLFCEGYFQRVAEICEDLIAKSNMSRQDRHALRAEIYKLMWSFQEDNDEAHYIPLDGYFKQLIDKIA